ncbi:TPA: murein transglycosylase [Photobacterium damselae]
MPSISSVKKIFVAVVFALGCSNTATAASLEQQRAWYDQAQKALDNKDISTFQSLRAKLNSYPLTPYLDYREFNAQLSDKTLPQVQSFLKEYSTLPFSTRVKNRYLTNLAADDQWRSYLAVQPTEPSSKWQQCNYVLAQSQTGKATQAWKTTREIWLTGKSLPNSCDDLLEAWAASGNRTNALILQRMQLVLARGDKGLLTHLDKQLSGSAKATGDKMLTLVSSPNKVGAIAKSSAVTATNQEMIASAYQLLARKDPKEAVAQYNQVVSGQKYSAAKKQELADYVASRLMSTQDPQLASWRDSKLKSSDNESVLARRIQSSIREANWSDARSWINRLPTEAKQSTRWTFWHAYVLAKAGKTKEANKIYQSLLGQRDFYSAAAATILKQPITYPKKTAAPNDALLKPYHKTLVRIRELVARDKVVAANSEWAFLLRRVDEPTKKALAVYAEQHKMHHLAVQATISAKMWDHISLRFPVAHKWWYQFFGEKRDIPMTTLMALSRQESAFNTHAQSYVGARGLMQLMPATAKETAQKLGRSYSGVNSLYDPGTNIRLGSGYLKMALDRFDNNRIYAFAGYNAGPGRVNQWRKVTDGKLDAFAFIEQIPFNETRNYVQNILMFDIFYGDQLGQKTSLLRPNELKARY